MAIVLLNLRNFLLLAVLAVLLFGPREGESPSHSPPAMLEAVNSPCQ
jgi:hypothetical protein